MGDNVKDIQNIIVKWMDSGNKDTEMLAFQISEFTEKKYHLRTLELLNDMKAKQEAYDEVLDHQNKRLEKIEKQSGEYRFRNLRRG